MTLLSDTSPTHAAIAATPAGSPTRTRSGPGSDFTALAQRVHASGLMRRRYGYYWTKMVALVALLAACGVGFVQVGDSWWQLVTAAVLAVLLTQAAFLGHDAAHRQIFVSGRWNDWASLVIANLVVGISYGWWRSKHTKHHANPNKEDVDPDIGLGTVAYTPEHARRAAPRPIRWLMAHQGWWFFPILVLEGLALHVYGIRRVCGRTRVERRPIEATFLALRLGGYLAGVFLVLPPGKALVFLAVQVGLFGFYLGSAFAPNHIGMPLVSARLKLDFLRRQVLMSRNIRGGRLMDVIMGGLNHQVEHHLFPSMPRPHLRRVRPLVQAHCRALGVPYTETTLWQSYAIVTRYLNTIGLRDRDPFLCPLVADRRAG